MLETAVVDTPSLDGGNEVWIEALPARIYHTPQYGPVEISRDKLERFVKNFNTRVRGQDVATDFDHGMDRAKGNQASGWYRELTIRPSTDDPTQMSLFARVALTEDASKELKDRKWRYFSLEWEDEWLDNQGRLWNDVVTGGGFTNKPVAKNVMPVNFSEAMWDELDYETKKEFAVWSTAFINNLPDSAFLYVQPGGKKDGEGKTTPRSLRHFPYKGTGGKVDLPHLRNAIARIPQAGSWLSDSLKSSLQSRARRLLSNAGGKSMSETLTEVLTKHGYGDATEEVVKLLREHGFEVTDESKEWEHSEPGTGNPPQPRTDEDGSDDPAIREGWRRDTPPIAEDPPSSQVTTTPPTTTVAPVPNTTVTPPTSTSSITTSTEGGKMTVEQEYELRNALGINGDGDIVEAVRLQLGELTELRRNVDAASQEKKFAEEYPAYWQEHNKLMDRDRENSAKAFSETVARVRKAEGYGLKETAKGLSAMSLSKVKDLHKKFSEGAATVDEFEDCIRTIVNGGIVEFGEIGASTTEDVPLVDTTTSGGIVNARKLFAEVVAKTQTDNPEWDYKKCMDEAAKKHPDLAEAYSVALPG